MTTFYESLQIIKKCAEPTLLVPNLCMCYDSWEGVGRLNIFNGKIFGELFVEDIGTGNWNVNAEKLYKIINEDSKLSIDDNMLIIKNKRSRFRLPLVNDVNVVRAIDMPDIEDGWIKLNNDDVEAILLADKFSSTDINHSWAASVSIYLGYAVATNNICAVSVKVPSFKDEDFLEPITFPIWIMPLFKNEFEIVLYNNLICYQELNGLHGYCATIQNGPPPAILDFCVKLSQNISPNGWYPIEQYRYAFNDIKIIGDKIFILSNDNLSTQTQDGYDAVAKLESVEGCNHEPLRLSKETLKLVLELADSLNFKEAPNRLRFLSSSSKMVGICCGMKI
jgi:hypothetical protein